jgi:hypothetical protein
MLPDPGTGHDLLHDEQEPRSGGDHPRQPAADDPPAGTGPFGRHDGQEYWTLPGGGI